MYSNYRGEGLELHISPVQNETEVFASRGIKSTPEDLLKLLQNSSEDSISISGYLASDGFSYTATKKGNLIIIVLSNRRHPISSEIANSIESILESKDYEIPLLRKEFILNPNQLKRFEGKYAINANVSMPVFVEKDSLFVMMGPNKVHLKA
ncbi:MAG: hypothetical protein ACI85I_001605 [Arenicella sp.]